MKHQAIGLGNRSTWSPTGVCTSGAGIIPVTETTSDHSIKSTIYASTVEENGGINGTFGIYLGYFWDIPGAFTCCLCVLGSYHALFLLHPLKNNHLRAHFPGLGASRSGRSHHLPMGAGLPSGYVKIAIEHGHLIIVDFPIKHGGSSHSFLMFFVCLPEGSLAPL